MSKQNIYNIAPRFESFTPWISKLASTFSEQGEILFQGRNEVRKIEVDGVVFNVKAFKIPHVFNRFAYRYIRPSKARRSFDYSNRLGELGVHSPEAVAWIETRKDGLLHRSFYVSVQHPYEFTIREVIAYKIADRDRILKAFVKYTFEKLHQNGVHHLDYSPGNVLIQKKEDGEYHFSLIDLNRMNFEPMPFLNGLLNFRQLNTDRETLELIGREYAQLNEREPSEAAQILIEADRKHKAGLRKKHKTKNFFKSLLGKKKKD